MQLDLPSSRIRSWRPGDEESLVREADNRNIWRTVRDRFPHPYTRAHADAWIVRATSDLPETHFAIDVAGEAVGGIGLDLQEDVARYSAELGYWLGEAYWGRGIMTAAVSRFTEYAFRTFELCRIYALVFETNPASFRVLERAGYALEGRLRRAVYKDGRILDQYLYAVSQDARLPHPPSCGGMDIAPS
ncbi:MAG TPA: GNAT family protein [Gemmatimonadales bacterium]|jgi:RimJ/RimL family protein N-acetyltransferase|nr:GNAT family protein [Gemmatimonadales bacterium]